VRGAPCEIGLHVAGKADPKGGCPVKIHIPKVLELMGNGRSARRWS
jgi:glutamate synthase (NADPH/NADH) small chain